MTDHLVAGGSADFRPLSDQDFAELERRGRASRRPIQFSAASRAALNERLRKLCGPNGDKLVRSERKAAATIRASVTRDAGRLLATLSKMQAATEPGARLAAWSLFPMERMRQFGDPRVTEEMLGCGLLMPPLTAQLKALCRLAEHRGHALKSDGEGGRPINHWARAFIVTVAAAFEDAGGVVSAAYQDAKGRRNSPFLRVLRTINLRLPSTRRMREAALDEYSRGVIKVLRRGGLLNRGETPSSQ